MSECVKKQVDLLCHDADNKMVSIEIAGSPGHEVHNCLYCLSFSEVRKHVVVCIDKKVYEAVCKRFNEVAEISRDERVEVTTLSKALKEEWIP